jgi:diguanylate cyclase (GGDEF)-like protein
LASDAEAAADMSIRTKLILALLLVTLLPFFGLLGFFHYSNNEQIERSGVTAQAQAAALLDAVERDFQHAVSEVRAWTASSSISRSALEAGALPAADLEGRWENDDYTHSSEAALLKDLQRISGNKFAEIFFTDPRGFVVASTNPTSDFGQGPQSDPPDGEPWWAEARVEGIRHGELTYDESAHRYAVDISITLSHEGRFAGVLKAVYNVESLLDIIGKSTVGRSGHAVLVDAQGNVIAAPRRFESIIFNDDANVSGFKANKIAERNASGYTFEHVPWVGQSMIGVASCVGPASAFDFDWSAMVIVPVEEALFSARQLFWFGALTLGAVALVLLGAVVTLSTRISKPLMQIADAVSQIEGGDFGVRVPHEGADEVGVLSTAINRMTKRLAVYDAMNVEKIKQLNVDLEQANGRLEQLATTDSLTGLWNRRTFFERLEQEISRVGRSDEPLSLILIDLDHFKNVNDTLGHQAGDEVLRRVGGLLQVLIRKSDMAARYGGEEMALILPGADKKSALEIAEHIRHLISAERIAVGDAPLNVTASMGVATIGDLREPSAASMVEIADLALYRAKHAGRNRVEAATPTAGALVAMVNL